MIIRIHKGSTVGGPLFYNYRKEGSDNAELLEAENMPFKPTLSNVKTYFDELLAGNRRCTNPIFTVSINPAIEDLGRLTDEDLKEMAKEYMEGMGYGEQPYIVFKHTDIERRHLHIVSCRVDGKGKVISDRFEQKTSSRLRRRMEIEYSLVKAEDRRRGQEEPENYTHIQIRKDIEENRDIKCNIRKALHSADRFNCSSMKEWNQALSIYSIEAQLINEGTDKEGIIYYTLDKEGERCKRPIKGSSIGKEWTAKQTKDRLEANGKRIFDKDKATQHIKKSVERRLKTSSTIEELSDKLKKDGIETLLQKRNDNTFYGITFIDTIYCTIAKGSSIGKDYGIGQLMKRLSDNKDNTSYEKKMFGFCSTAYNKIRKESLNEHKYESLFLKDINRYYERIGECVINKNPETSYASVSNTLDNFIDYKLRHLQEIEDRERELFINRADTFLPYLSTLDAKKRYTYLKSIDMECTGKHGIIAASGEGSEHLTTDLAKYGLTAMDIITDTSNKTKPLNREDREALKLAICGHAEQILFNEYRPFHPVRELLNTADKNSFIRHQVASEAERIYKKCSTVEECVSSLIDSGFIIHPIKKEDGKIQYAVSDFNDDNPAHMAKISEKMAESLDAHKYYITYMHIMRKIYTDKGYPNPLYKTIVRLHRANSIEDTAKRDIEIRKAIRFISNYDPGVASEIIKKIRKGIPVKEAILKLTDFNLENKKREGTTLHFKK